MYFWEEYVEMIEINDIKEKQNWGENLTYWFIFKLSQKKVFCLFSTFNDR